MDMATIVSAYSAVKNIKEIGEVLLNAKIDADSKQRVTEVIEKLGGIQDTLFYIREELLKVQEENHNLKVQVKQLEEKLQQKGKLQYIKPSYWVVEGETGDGPFCQRCYDAESKLVRLQEGSRDFWNCRECKNNYHGPNYTPPKPIHIERF